MSMPPFSVPRASAPAAVPMMTLGEAQALLPAATLVGDAGLPLVRVASDTRSLKPGDFFVALRGERFDAHDFLADARAAGAAAALAQHGLFEAGLPGLLVPDTQHALQSLAGAWRRRLELPLVAVTGSNGKTTVTQMTAAVLRAWLGDGAFATEGNFNNHVGLPLTLLRLRQDAHTWHRAAVVELGMNHPGEIERLARIAAPTVGLVNNAQREHQEFMADVDAVARENGHVIEALGPSGVAVFPAGDAHAPLWAALAGARAQLTFALDGADAAEGAARADVRAGALWLGEHWEIALRTPAGPARIELGVAGLHNVHNALAATACALAAGAPLEAVVRGLEAFRPVKGRSRVTEGRIAGRVVRLVDDSYNANPDSMRAAIGLLAQLPAPRALLMGDMGEVGDRGPAFHAEVGAFARAQGIDLLWAAGDASAAAVEAYADAPAATDAPAAADAAAMPASARHFADVPALVGALHELPAGTASVLVKGSRFMRMERVVVALEKGGHAA